MFIFTSGYAYIPFVLNYNPNSLGHVSDNIWDYKGQSLDSLS